LIRAGTIPADVPLLFISVLSEQDDVSQQELGRHTVLTGRYVWLQKYFETDLLLETFREELGKRSSCM
jgi:hypothetical protein